MTWRVKDTLIYKLNKPFHPNLVIFDLDSTLVTTKSGKVHPKDAADWKWWNSVVPERLQQLADDPDQPRSLVIYTNQSKIGKKLDGPKAQEIQDRIAQIEKQSKVKFTVLIATQKDQYRKPALAAYDFLLKKMAKHGVDKPASVCYVGDAAGRLGDFSCSDRKFAANAGLSFYTPEEYFLNVDNASDSDSEETQGFSWGFHPQHFLDELKGKQQQLSLANPNPDQAEVVILVGIQGSGKSTLVKNHFQPPDYTHISNDLQGTKAKAMRAARAALEGEENMKGRSLIVDNTHPSLASRQPYLDLAKEYDLPVRILVMDTPLELAKHLNLMREALGRPRIPDIAYNMYKKHYLEPSLDESTQIMEIIKVDFNPQFKSEEHLKQFLMFTSPK